MKKKLALLISLLSIMAVSSMGFAACGKDGGNKGNSVESSSPVDGGESSEVGGGESGGESSEVGGGESCGGEEQEASLTLDQTSLAMGQYEVAVLEATLENAEGDIEWSSSNESVAKVVNGEITTYGAGEAVVTASVGELSATCTVTVTAADVAPAFTALDDEMEIIKGIYEELDLTVEFNGEAWTDVTVSVATEGDVVTVDEDEGYYGLIGAEYGTQTVTATAQWNGVTVAEKAIEVTVIEYGALIVDLPDNKLELFVGEEGYALSNISVLINDEEVENPEFGWESSAESVAKVEDGKIVPVGAGTADITISYTTEKDVYDTVISVTVAKNVIAKDVNFFVQGDAGKNVANTGNVTVDLSATEIDLSQVTNVLCGEKEVTFAVDGTNLKLTDAPGGYQIYTLQTATKDYTIDGCVYGYSIDTAEELLDWRKNCSNYKAYTVMTADIDLGGITLDGQYNALGVLDGMGHTVSNFIYTNGVGFLKYISAGAAVKNIQFVNAIQDCSTATSAVAIGLFGDNLMGTIENILMKVAIKDMAETLEHYGVTVHYSSNGSLAKNVLVYVTAIGSTPKYIYGHSASGQGDEVVDNVQLIMADTISGAVTGRKATNSGMYATEADMLAEVDFSAWNGWSTTEDGVPYMSDYTDDMANPAVIATGEARVGKSIAFTDTSLVALTYSLEGETTGITLEDKVVTIGADAGIGATFKVVVSCAAYPEFSKEYEYTIVKEKVAIAGEYLVKANGGKWSYDTGSAVADFSSAEVDFTNVTSVLLDGEEFADYTASGSTLTLNNAPGGDHEITITTDTHIYYAQVCVYVNGISTVEELETWRTSESYWYTVLLNDIDYEGATLTDGANVLGILDGRGYTIKNFTHANGFVNRLYAAESVIKNVKFTGVTQDCSAWTGGVDRGTLGQWNNGTLENVYLQVHTTGVVKEHYGALCFGMDTGSVIKNVVVEITSDSTLFHYVMMHDYALADGNSVGIVGSYANGATESAESAWGTDSGFHQKLSWMLVEEANDELLTFTSAYWQIDTTARTIDLKPWAPLEGTAYLVKEGVTDYAILVDASEESTYATAIEELQTLFNEATGATLSVVTSDVAYNRNAKYISLGNTNAFITSEIAMSAELGSQGYQITTKGKSIFIVGESQGVLYGVYELMHQLFDFEQYTTEYYYMDAGIATMELPTIDTWSVPDIEYRIGMSGEQRNGTAQVRNRMRVIRSEDVLITEGGAHNMLTYIVPFDTYYSTNPTWFSSLTTSSSTATSTQLCYTAGDRNGSSYTEMVSVAVNNIMTILNANPSASVFSLTQMDIQNMWCQCSACSTLQSTYGTAAASQILFVNDVTAQVKEQLGDREVQFMTFAYLETVDAPVTDNGDGTYTAIDNIKLNDNVSIWIAPIGEDYTSASAHENIDTLLTKWNACADSCFIWAYNVYFYNYLVAYDTYDYIDDLVQTAVAQNAKYFWAQGSWNLTRSTGFDDLKAYLFSKLMWDSTLDVETLTNDFFAKVYGAAAEKMKAVYDAWRTQSATQDKDPGGDSVKSIYENIATSSHWTTDWINTQITNLNAAAALVDASSVAYEAIQCELVMYKYLLLEVTSAWQRNWNSNTNKWMYSSDYNAWQAALTEFKTLAETYGFNYVKEQLTLEDYCAIVDKS